MGNIEPKKEYEQMLREQGYRYIAGFDCSGNDSGVGMIVGVLVVLKPDYYNENVRDGKWLWNASNRTLSDKNRLFKIEKDIKKTHYISNTLKWIYLIEICLKKTI